MEAEINASIVFLYNENHAIVACKCHRKNEKATKKIQIRADAALCDDKKAPRRVLRL